MRDNIAYIKENKNTYLSAFADFFLYNFSDKDKIVDIDRNLKREFRYGLKPKKVVGASIYSLVLLLILLVIGILTSFDYRVLFVPCLVFFPVLILGLIVVINHIAYSVNKELAFVNNSDEFVLYFGSHSELYNKNNIEIIQEFHTEGSGHLPWEEREYWKIKMNNGEVIIVSNLIMSDLDIMKHFDLSKIHRNITFYPIIR